MKSRFDSILRGLGLAVLAFGLKSPLAAQEAPRFTGIQRTSSQDILLNLSASTGTNCRIDVSTNLVDWISLLTLRSTGSDQHTDSAAPYLSSRFYRVLPVSGTNVFTGDHLATDDGEVIIHPINHASFVMSWKGKMIYSDPVGGAAPYQGFPRADLILVTHGHGDHFDAATLNTVRGTNAVIIAPQPVYNSLSAALRNLTLVMSNGATTNALDLTIQAVTAYNNNHPRGDGNGYVLTIGGKRIYLSGDTGNTPEMRALQDIDVAFLCVNVPFTMSVTDAANAVRAFRPRIVLPLSFSESKRHVVRFKCFQTTGRD